MVSKRPYSIKRASDFQKLRENGKRKTVAPWLFVSYLKTSEDYVRFGVTASRKVGNAVVRNRLKRWCREIVKQVAGELSTAENQSSVDINFIFKPVADGFIAKLQYRDFKSAVEPILRKICSAC